MKTVNELLAAILSESSFDLEFTEITHDGRSKELPGQSVTASNLREVFDCYQDRIVKRRAYKQAPEALMSQLIEALRLVLGRFIDPESDWIGHAFRSREAAIRVPREGPLDSLSSNSRRRCQTSRALLYKRQRSMASTR